MLELITMVSSIYSETTTSAINVSSLPLPSEHAGGSKFRDSINPSSETEEETKAKPLALVVDDAPDVTEMIGMLMRFAGFEVVTAFGAAEAFDAARRRRFDVIISDIGMPGMNGYELAEALRALPSYEAVPLIAVTGFSMYDDRERALGSGFNDFLTKPINPMDLINTVKRLRE
jgi:CheY-like chemotaxis protein